MGESATKVITIRLPEDMAAQLELVARVEGRSQSEVIRDAIDSYIAHRMADPGFHAAAAGLHARDKALAAALAPDLVEE